MWYVTHFRSDPNLNRRTRYLALSLLAVFAVALSSLGTLGALVTTDRYIVTEESPIAEDQYVTAVSAVVEGRLDGDLTIFTGSLRITGEVTGNVTVFSTGPVTVEEGGSIGGSLNATGSSVSILGSVGSDVFSAAGSTVVQVGGSVGRDVMAFGGTSRVNGSVERDVRGRIYRATIDGFVGGDVDIATQSLSIGADAVVDGDVVYRSSGDAAIDATAEIAGTVTRLPAESNFIYGLILSLANVIGFLGFVAAGLVALWIIRGTGARATGLVITRPIRTFLTGLLVVVLVPLAIVLLAVTLVGIPLALVVIALAVIGFIIGAVPAVAALGNRVLIGRGGLFGGFIVGAILWRLGIWLIPWVGGALFILGLVWGLGAWALGVRSTRRAEPIPVPLLPAGLIESAGGPEDWDPPLAPGAAAASATGGVTSPRVVEMGDRAMDADTAAEPSEAEDHEAPDPYRQRDASHLSEPVSFGEERSEAGTMDGDDSDVSEGSPDVEEVSDQWREPVAPGGVISFADPEPIPSTAPGEPGQPEESPAPPGSHDQREAARATDGVSDDPADRGDEAAPVEETRSREGMSLEERLAAFREELRAVDAESDDPAEGSDS